jgi:hypothetical protein
MKHVSTVPSAANWRRLRLIPLAFGILAMALGLWTGVTRMGLALPQHSAPSAEFHGALMISGFLGTVISLERAVALRHWWAYAAPALASAGVLSLIAGAPSIAAIAFLTASAILLLASAIIAVHQPATFTIRTHDRGSFVGYRHARMDDGLFHAGDRRLVARFSHPHNRCRTA